MKTKTYPFEWLDNDGLMVVHVEINSESILPFLLDTGASNTYLDKNILYTCSLRFEIGVEWFSDCVAKITLWFAYW